LRTDSNNRPRSCAIGRVIEDMLAVGEKERCRSDQLRERSSDADELEA
jgi:hypothetical protein